MLNRMKMILNRIGRGGFTTGAVVLLIAGAAIAHRAAAINARHSVGADPVLRPIESSERSIGIIRARIKDNAVRPCQAICDCDPCSPWQDGQAGEYVEHARAPHIMDYHLRVDDVLRCIYRITRDETTAAYKLNVGDEVLVESFSDPNLNRSVVVQPDGKISLRLLGQVPAAHFSVVDLREHLEKAYHKYYVEPAPAISITPVRVNTMLEDLRATVDARAGTGGQGLEVRVAPDGTISLPAVGQVYVQGMNLKTAGDELNQCYAYKHFEGVEITPILESRAPRYIYVLGEVKLPGRYSLEGPTTVMQAMSLGGSWNVGANLKQVVVFRRGDDWRLMATMVDLQDALAGKCKCPGGEIWLGDGDVVLVPKSTILRADDFINLVFTRGIYGVLPFTTSYEFGLSAAVLK